MSRPVLLLARAFFRRFFESELMQQGIPQVQLVIWSVALVIAPGLLLSLRSALTYARLRMEGNIAGLMQAMLIDRLLLITISMAALGLVGLVIWDGVFPDRRDARHLGILPLPGRVLIQARLVALCALAGLFLIGVNALPTLMYGSLAGEYGAAAGTWRGILAHGVASACAGAFAFFAVIAVQGVLLNVVGRQTAERLSLVLQVIMVAALLQLVLLLPNLRAMASDPDMRWIPSFWFLGLYEVLAGQPAVGIAHAAMPHALMLSSAQAQAQAQIQAQVQAQVQAQSHVQALVAVVATLAATASALGLFAATHRRLMRMALESGDASRAKTRMRMYFALFAVDWVGAIVSITDRGPLSRAIAAFTLQTIARSRPHRMLLSTYIGLASAIIVSTIGPAIIRDGWRTLREPGLAMLAAPLVLQFCAIIGVRLLLAIPVEPKANWIVRQLEPKAGDRRLAIDSVRNVLLAAIVLPIAATAGAMALAFWSTWHATVHLSMCVGMGWLLVESVLAGFRKIPFTCTYFPGRSRVRTLWPFYLVALVLYSFGAAALERAIMPHPHDVVLVIVALAVAIALLTWIRARMLAEPFGLRFEEEDPDALFEGFRFSEWLAAATANGTDLTRAAMDAEPQKRVS